MKRIYIENDKLTQWLEYQLMMGCANLVSPKDAKKVLNVNSNQLNNFLDRGILKRLTTYKRELLIEGRSLLEYCSVDGLCKSHNRVRKSLDELIESVIKRW